MANPKRASMREGPLAALFRKTEDLEKDAVEQPPAPGAATPAGAGEPAAQASASEAVPPSAVAEPAAASRLPPRPRRRYPILRSTRASTRVSRASPAPKSACATPSLRRFPTI